MSSPEPIAPLLEALGASTAWLRAARTKGAVIGGVAASLHGRPRVTRDIDLVVLAPDDEWAELVDVGKRFDIVPRRRDVLTFARATRVLLMRHAPSGVDLDVSLGALPFERALVERSVSRRIRGVSFRIATAEDVVVMKSLALRPRDVADIEGILDAVPNLEMDRVRRDVRALAELADGPDFLGELERIVAARRRRSRTRTDAKKRK
ncbi:MAG: hypothetical protein HOV80_07155 [Polyangiaceae bacterium]|nr:hypothetical protein [Polyangiaceae bacterium]